MSNAVVNTLPGVLGIPSFLDTGGIEIWLEQQIWGHRLYNDQTPWLLLLEAVGLMAFRSEGQNCAQRIFPGDNCMHENMRYELRATRRLRQILFADRSIDAIAQQHAVSDAVLWTKWFNICGMTGEADFGYLRARFVKFSSFQNAVTLLRGSEVEPHRKRRLTSRHLAPRGPSMLSADYGEGRKRSAGVDKDRRFFARGVSCFI